MQIKERDFELRLWLKVSKLSIHEIHVRKELSNAPSLKNPIGEQTETETEKVAGQLWSLSYDDDDEVDCSRLERNLNSFIWVALITKRIQQIRNDNRQPKTITITIGNGKGRDGTGQRAIRSPSIRSCIKN